MIQGTLQRTVSYRALLRVIGWLFVLYSFYLIMLALTAQIEVSGSIQYSGSMLFIYPEDVRNYIFCGGRFPGNPFLPFLPLTLVYLPFLFYFMPGPLLWLGIGLLCLSVTSARVRVIYACLHIALWMISMSVWFPLFSLLHGYEYTVQNFLPYWLVTLALSLILLVCYKPVLHFLRKLFEPAQAATQF